MGGLVSWVGTAASSALVVGVLSGGVGAVATQALASRSRRRADRSSRGERVEGVAVEVVTAAGAVQAALAVHAQLWLSRGSRWETIAVSAVEAWAGWTEHGPPTAAARAVRTASAWRREGLTVAASVAARLEVFQLALGRWFVLVDPGDHPLGVAVADAVQELAAVHIKSARRRRAAERRLEEAGSRLVAAARTDHQTRRRRRGRSTAGRGAAGT